MTTTTSFADESVALELRPDRDDHLNESRPAREVALEARTRRDHHVAFLSLLAAIQLGWMAAIAYVLTHLSAIF